MVLLQITVAVLVMLAVAVGYGYSKYSAEVEILNKQLIETKGCCEAHQMCVANKEEAVKQSSETHVAKTDQLLKSAQDSLADCRKNTLKKDVQRSKQMSDLQRKLSSVRDHRGNTLTELVAIVSSLYQVPMEFIISDYREKKEADEVWYSSPFYTHNRGYKFRLKVHLNGVTIGRGSHFSVYAQLMIGEYDNELEWPFEGDIRVELLNWRADKNHNLGTIPFNRYRDRHGKYSSRVTNQDTATSLGIPQFIFHTDLVSTTNSEYLLNNYLKLSKS